MTHEFHLPDNVPPLTMGWRLKMALDWGQISAEQMATELGVSRQSVSRWMNIDDLSIRAAYLKQWAAICEVDLVWLLYGDVCSGCTDAAPVAASASTSGPTKRRWSSLAPVYELRPIRLDQTA